MPFSVSVRIPVKRTYPKVRDVPGQLYMNASVYSEQRVPAGGQVQIRTLTGAPLIAEVIESSFTQRAPESFLYTLDA